MYSTREAPRPPLWVTAVDVLSVVLLFLALTVWVKGGFVLHPAGVRVSFREEWRIFAWAIGLLVVRHAFFRRPAIHHRIVSGMREVARTQRALPLDDLLFKRAVTPPRPPNSTLFLRAVAVICLFWGLTFVMTYPQIRVLDRGVSMDIGDPLLSTWRLSWFAHQLPRDPMHLFDGNIFYPEKNTLAFSDAMIVPSLTVAPLVWLGVHQLLYQLQQRFFVELRDLLEESEIEAPSRHCSDAQDPPRPRAHAVEAVLDGVTQAERHAPGAGSRPTPAVLRPHQPFVCDQRLERLFEVEGVSFGQGKQGIEHTGG